MPVEGLDTVWDAIQRAIPDVFIKRRLNFITIHYLYLGGMTLFWGAILYALGGMAFIDAVFFASGSCTQSGLNTINLNQMNTAQQAILYGLAMLCNPIAINTSVVFVRLYWFERRFKDIVREARTLRATRTKSFPRVFSRNRKSDDSETASRDLSVRGRAIRLLRHTGHPAEGTPIHAEKPDQDMDKDIERSPADDSSGSGRQQESPAPLQGAKTDSLEDMRLPQQMDNEQHIRFLENQLNPVDDTTLRIPSPMEFDRGGRVQSIDNTNEDLTRQRTALSVGERPIEESKGHQMANHITFNEPNVPRHRDRHPPFPRSESGKASTVDPSTYESDPFKRGRSRTRRNSFLHTNTVHTLEATPYLSWQPTVARNSFFVNLTEQQREELGGIEYRALKTLALVLLGYFFLFHLLGIVCLTPWIYHHYGSIVTQDGQGRAWWGVFTAASSFNDLGFTLTPDSMNSFNNATFPLLLMTYLIIIGNTGFPCMLRFVIWALSKCVPVGSGLWEELQFLLDHPRRCFTLLFPRAATWWLFAILVVLNSVDLIFFVVLDINNSVVDGLSGWEKFLDGLFQAASTRTAGFSVVNIADLHPAIQVSYLIMMYISVFPIAISMRRTNVYEEKSLGIYVSAEEEEEDEKEPSYVSAHLRKQLSFDLWYIFLGLFVIAIVEGTSLADPNKYAFSLFSVLFEIVSAYGTVGLSLGYPNVDTSLSGQFHVLSKLVIVAMMLRGRHRGLPYELDRAILLPSESLHEKEAAEGEKILQRRRSSILIHDSQANNEQFRPAMGTTTATSTDRRQLDSQPRPENVRNRQKAGQETCQDGPWNGHVQAC